ncbi:MAG TPA: condensation domain-containing protein [Pyrinomonadaceae bacterium]|nr:condensation domain-containing protein [Pyrinomonadaceae bacterium]
MHAQDGRLKDHTLSTKSAALSPVEQALLQEPPLGGSLSPVRLTQTRIERVARTQELPLSFLLEDVLAEFWSSPEGDTGTLNRCFRLQGTFNEAAMELAINELARRHEVLRTTFSVVNGRARQVIARPVRLTVPVIDLHSMAHVKRLEEALRILAQEAQRPYDPSRSQLWRVVIVRLDESEHLLLLSVSHLIADGSSINLLIKDSWILYRAFSTGTPSPLTEIPIQFADYACWQRSNLQGSVLEDLVSYWKRNLDGLKVVPEILLPFERTIPTENNERTVVIQHLQVPASLLESLRELSRREGVTLFMLVFAALITTLHRYTGNHDFGILSPVTNRHRPETTGVVGWLADYIVLRVKVPAVATFPQLLQKVRDVVLEAYDHQELPFSKFYGNSSKVWKQANSYSSVRFNMMAGTGRSDASPSQSGGATRMGGFVLTSIDLPQSMPSRMSPPGLDVLVRENDHQLHVNITHELERHEAAAVNLLLQDYLKVLEGVACAPQQRLAEILLSSKTISNRAV